MSEEAKDDVRQVKAERLQRSHGRLIRVVSVFPQQGSAPPEDKLKALINLDAQQGKLCAYRIGHCPGFGVLCRRDALNRFDEKKGGLYETVKPE